MFRDDDLHIKTNVSEGIYDKLLTIMFRVFQCPTFLITMLMY